MTCEHNRFLRISQNKNGVNLVDLTNNLGCDDIVKLWYTPNLKRLYFLNREQNVQYTLRWKFKIAWDQSIILKIVYFLYVMYWFFLLGYKLSCGIYQLIYSNKHLQNLFICFKNCRIIYFISFHNSCSSALY